MYTKLNLNIVTLIITIIIFFSFNYIFENISNAYNKSIEEKRTAVIEEEKVEPKEKEVVKGAAYSTLYMKEGKTKEKLKEKTNKSWILEIPKIKLKAKIAKGVTDKTMNKYIGHFNESSKWNGNIGLAAHNRGYPVNYFKDLKKLKKGDKIFYTYKNKKRTYIVNKIMIIEDTDWTCLEETVDNRITLITCVEDKPGLRRVVQGIEREVKK